MTESISRPPKIDRRSALKGAAVGAGITVLTGVAASLNGVGARQIDLETPPPATPGLIEPEPDVLRGPTVASKAAELGYDVEKIFRFVAEDIRYEAYSGALRGANGTLWSLAGNSVDKSILLAALLDESLITYRFASGKLDDTNVAALTTAMTPKIEQLQSSFASAFEAGFAPRSSGVLEHQMATPEIVINDEDQQALDELSAMTTKMFDLAQTLTTTQMKIIGDALDAAGIELPALPAATLPADEVTRHQWIQVADGPVWIDYAPAFGGAATGVDLLQARETYPETPDDRYHQVTIRLVVEEFIGGTNARRDVATLNAPSTALVNAPVAIAVLPPDSFQGLGLTINQLFTGNASFVPMLLANDLYVVADSPIVFGSSGGTGDLFGDTSNVPGPKEGEALGLWLAVDIASPDAEPIAIERPLLDRIGAEARQAGTIDFAAIKPVALVGDFNGSPIVPELAAAHLLTIDVARLPFSYALGNAKDLETYGPISLNAPSVTAFRDGLRLQTEVTAGQQSYIARPHVTLTSLVLVDAADPASAVSMGIDLLYHDPAVVTLAAGPPNTTLANPFVHAAVLNQVAEQIVFHPDLIGGADSGNTVVIGPNVGSIMAAAIDNDIPIVTISSLAELTGLELGSGPNALIEQALAEGWIAIAPARPVPLAGEERSGWWLIDPITGRTKDQLDNGRSYASIVLGSGGKVFTEGAESSIMYRIGLAVGRAFRFLGKRIDCILVFAVVIFTGLVGGWNGAAYASSEGNPGNAFATGAAAAGAATAIRNASKAGGACV